MHKKKFRLTTKTVLNTVALLLLSLSPAAFAAEVTLAWDPVDVTDVSYRLYQRTSSQQEFEEVWLGNETTQTIDGLAIGTTYYFTVRAVKGDRESQNSNQLIYTPTDETSGSSSDSSSNGLAGLTPTLTVPSDHYEKIPGTYSHTLFQISTSPDFSGLVFERTYNAYLTDLTINELILEPDTDYYWRVRYHDDDNAMSDWSPQYTFTTIDYAAYGDVDGNGIKDDQEVLDDVDMDRDGINDNEQSNIITIKSSDSDQAYISVKSEDPDVQIGSISALNPEDLTAAPNQPEEISNLISFKLYLDNDADRATVTVFFSEPAPEGAEWLKYDPVEGWTAYSSATFSADRLSVTFEVEDGGIGDQDGVKNGIIVDPAGLGIYSQSSSSVSTEGISRPSGSSSGGGTGCFIAAPLSEPNQAAHTSTVLLVAIAVGLLSFIRIRRRDN